MAKAGRPSNRGAVLAGMPGTRSDISRKSGISVTSVDKWLRELHKVEKVIRVQDWLRSRQGSFQPVWLAEAGPDAEKPPVYSQSERYSRYMETVTDGRKAYYSQRDKKRYQKKKAAKRLIFAALGL